MNKKLIAVAVAGAFAAPAAFAQSSVTISGQIKGGFEGLSYGNYGNPAAGRAAGTNRSQTGVVDDSSAVVFTVLEDLGGGMQAEARIDLRPSIDTVVRKSTGSSTSSGLHCTGVSVWCPSPSRCCSK